MKKLSLSLALVAVVSIICGSATAGPLKILPTIDTDGTNWALLLEDVSDEGASLGIVSYGITMEGGIVTLEHVSPATLFAQDANFEGGAAGFSFLRSANDVLLVGASQDTVGPTPHLLNGYGQVASSFADEGLNAIAPTNPPGAQVWDVPLLIAVGTYEGEPPRITESTAGVFVNLFTAEGGIAPAEIVPEPTALALAGMSLIGIVALRRRRS